MLGAIAGDMIGSIYEGNNIKTKDFPLFSPQSRFTDDTVLTVAIADALLHQRDYTSTLKQYYHSFPKAGYGGTFRTWATSQSCEPYNSWGNGSAMRVSPVAYAYHTLEAVLSEAKRSAAVTHNHPEGIKGAQATAAAIFLARKGQTQADIKTYIETAFAYDLSRSLAEIRPDYRFDVSCQGSVPQAIMAFLEAMDFEDALRNAISLGGDSDTIACIAGSIAEAFYGVPEAIVLETKNRLPSQLLNIVETFTSQYISVQSP